jgi:hypothetical protein
LAIRIFFFFSEGFQDFKVVCLLNKRLERKDLRANNGCLVDGCLSAIFVIPKIRARHLLL